jgi:hypothetical protein
VEKLTAIEGFRQGARPAGAALLQCALHRLWLRPELFADAVKDWHLPQDRAEGCHDEYRQVDLAFRRLIRPYVDQAMFERVRARKWLQFEVQR